ARAAEARGDGPPARGDHEGRISEAARDGVDRRLQRLAGLLPRERAGPPGDRLLRSARRTQGPHPMVRRGPDAPRPDGEGHEGRPPGDPPAPGGRALLARAGLSAVKDRANGPTLIWSAPRW